MTNSTARRLSAELRLRELCNGLSCRCPSRPSQAREMGEAMKREMIGMKIALKQAETRLLKYEAGDFWSRLWMLIKGA